MATIHIGAERGDIADVVLMPGDPLRARYMAERFLTDSRQVTAVRNMLGFTGHYKGKRISVMGHGMGIPSISIYATELIKDFGARVILRVGSSGALREDIALREIVIAQAAGTDSLVNRIRMGGYDFPAVADFGLLRRAVEIAEKQGQAVRVGSVFSSDLFYHPDEALGAKLRKMGMLAIEMEVAGLYGLAAEHGARALAMVSISDHLLTGAHLSSAERETTFDAMAKLALDVGISEAE